MLIAPSSGISHRVHVQSNAVGAASSRSSTYCRSTRVGCCVRKAARSRCKASLNRVGLFLNPCGNLVHVSCPDSPASGSFHSKANRGRLWGLSLKQRKASFRSNTVYQVWEGGKVLSRLYGLGTVGWMSSTRLFTSLRSCMGL